MFQSFGKDKIPANATEWNKTVSELIQQLVTAGLGTSEVLQAEWKRFVHIVRVPKEDLRWLRNKETADLFKNWIEARKHIGVMGE